MVEIRGDGTIMRTLSKIFSSILVFSLLLMGLFAPLQAQAGFFSSLLGDEAYADTVVTEEVQSNKDIQQNSQTMSLLQANVSSASIFPAKNDKKDSKKDDQIDENINVNILSDNAMLPATGPMGVSDGKDAIDSSCGDITTYKVIENDSISKVAKMLGVTENTVLVANGMKKKLVKDDVLFIQDISGVKVTVTSGQTLQIIAKRYKVNINDIAFCNGIAPDAKLATGVELMIPGGDIADEGGDKPAPNLGSALSRDLQYYAIHSLQELVDYFIYPLPLGIGRKTQGLHGPGHRGIDYGAPKGTPIYASAKGVVNIVCKGWCGGYGLTVAIGHSEKNTKTLYAHMSKIVTFTGASVNQGEVIGYVGSTGHSTGPHLHFEVFNARNPGADWSWAN